VITEYGVASTRCESLTDTPMRRFPRSIPTTRVPTADPLVPQGSASVRPPVKPVPGRQAGAQTRALPRTRALAQVHPASAQRLTQLDQRFLDTGDVSPARRRKLRRAAAATADRGSSQDRDRPSIDPGALSGSDDQRNPIGTGDTGKTDGLDPGMISNRDRKFPQLPSLEPVPTTDHSSSQGPPVAAGAPAANTSASLRNWSERNVCNSSSSTRWLASSRSSAEARSEG